MATKIEQVPSDQTCSAVNHDAHSVEQGRLVDAAQSPGLSYEWIGLAAAVIVAFVTYGIYTAHPWPHSPMSVFLVMFRRGNADIWPMQLTWYAVAFAIVGLAVWPLGSRRPTTQVICLLAASYLAWQGIAFFAVLNNGMNFAALWSAVFVFEGILFLVAGVARSDLTVCPSWNAASVLGATFMGYSLLGYPIIGMLGGHPLSSLPVFGFSPCAAAIFFIGLLLWAQPPAPVYLLPLLLAWAFGAAPPDLARGVAADVGMVVAGMVAALVILWRDRGSSVQTVIAGGALALMVGWSGHEDVQMGLALILVLVTLTQTIRGSQRATTATGIQRPLDVSAGAGHS